MNTRLSVLFLSAMLIASVGLAPSFAQTTDPIVVSTDKESYSAGDTIIVSGEVEHNLPDAISLQVIAPNGNLVGVKQLTADSERQFSVEIAAGGTGWNVDGDYTVHVVYGSESREATTTFSFDRSASMESGSGSDSDPNSFPVEGTEFSAIYSITGGSVTSITVEGTSLFVAIDATDDGVLTLTLPRELIDAKMDGSDEDMEFNILIDNEFLDNQPFGFSETKDDVQRTLVIPFSAGSESIEIVGTYAIPEFGTVAVLILAVAIISIIAVSARSRLSIMPKY